MSKALLLCLVLAVCVACVPGDSPQVRAWPLASQNGPQLVAAQNLSFATGLAAGQPAVLLVAFAQADSGWPQNTGPAGGWVPSRQDIEQLIGFDAGVLPALSPQEVLELATWLDRGIWFQGDWSVRGLQVALQGLQMMLNALAGNLDVMMAVLDITNQTRLVYRVCADCFATGNHFSQPEQHRVTFDSNPDLTSFLHETGHIMDFYLARGLETHATWWSDVGFLGLGWKKQVHQSGEAGVYYLDTDEDAPHSEYSPREDFADTFAAWVLEENSQPLPRGWRNPSYRRVLLLVSVPRALFD